MIGVLKPLTIAALAAAGMPFGIAEADARPTTTRPACMWNGAAFQPGKTVVAGGSIYRCGDQNAEPYWFREGATNQASTVPNPGARTDPTGRFSAGARQPGTSYNDYCVGAQLIEGTDDIYQVVRIPGNRLMWKAAAPISQWPFDSARPEATWRSASLCYDGNLT